MHLLFWVTFSCCLLLTTGRGGRPEDTHTPTLQVIELNGQEADLMKKENNKNINIA